MNRVLLAKILLGILGGVLGIFVSYFISYGMSFVVPSVLNGPIALFELFVIIPFFAWLGSIKLANKVLGSRKKDTDPRG